MSGGDTPDQDGEMVAQLQRGEAIGVEALYDKYGRLAYSLAYRILNERTAAEDVVQEAFLAMWRNARSFNAARDNVRNWLLSIVHNRAIDRVRGSTRIRKESQIETMERLIEVPDAWETVSAHLERTQILEGFALLPDAQRRTLELSYFGGYTQAVGIVGFLPFLGGSYTQTSSSLLGIFPINLLHNLVHAVIGIAGIAAAASLASSRTFNQVVGVVLLLLGVVGIFVAQPLGLLNIGGPDIALHLLTGGILAYFGFAAATTPRRATA